MLRIFPYIFLSLLFCLPLINSYTNNGFSISDLEYTNSNFITEANTWTASGLMGSNIYWLCSSTYLLGGYGILQTGCSNYNGNYGWCNQWGQYFTKTYYNLPAHSYVYFSTRWWAFYTWDYPYDYFELDFDSYAITGWSMAQGSFPSTCYGYVCVPDFYIYGRFPHTASTLTVTFISRMDEASTNEFWGVRDLDLQFTSTSSSTYTCAASTGTIPNLPSSWECPCGTPGYYGSGCTQCDASCKSCWSSGSASCYACADGYAWSGTNCVKCHAYCSVCYGTSNDQCHACNSGYYLWEGNTCIASCSSPLVKTTSDSSLIQLPAVSQTVCSYPCTIGFYLDWNGDCQGSCDFPLQATTRVTDQGPIYVCNYPCDDDQYLYWDGMCEDSCDTPLYATTYNGKNMCNFPCNTEPNTIAYWDGSCNSTCAFPLIYVIAHEKEFCTDPCTTSGYYLYSNGSCLATCQKYFIPASFAGKLFCYYPCTSDKYLYSNGSCLSTCTSPFYNLTMLADKYCYYPCLPTEYLYNNGSCISTCDWRFNVRVLVSEQYCDFPCSTRIYLYLNGSCINYCRTYYNPWYDKAATTNYYCDNPCNTSIMLNNGTCRTSCDSSYIYYKGGSDKFCDYPCEPSQYLYTNGSCLLTCVPYYHPSNYLGDRFCDNPCSSGQYIYYNGSCMSTCNTPFTATSAGTDLLCKSPCKAGDYLYNNYTCLSWCTPGFIESSYGSEFYCNYPCTSSQYLYQDGTCQSSCQTYFTPLTYGTDKFCYYPCDPTHYLYSNGSCLSTCNPLFIEVTVNVTGLKYCNNPCSPTTYFIYWDGTCKSTCSSPLVQRTEGTNHFCVYPCTEGSEYLYWNSSCLSKCEFPLVSATKDGLLYCGYPCTTSEYLRWDGECVSSCSSPLQIYIQGSEIRCLPPCKNQAEYYYEETGQCSSDCKASSRVTGDLYLICSSASGSSDNFGLINSLSSPSGDSRSISFITVARQIQYLKYLDIYLPPKLLRLIEGKANHPLNLNTAGLVVPEDAAPTFSSHILPVVFWKQGLSYGYLANFWLPLMVLGILIFIGIIFYLLEIFCKKAKWRDWQEIFERFRIVVLWNLVIILLATNIDSIILYSSLEFRVLSFNSSVEIFSFICCLLVMILSASIILISSVFAVKSKFMKNSQSGSYNSYSAFLVRWQALQVVYRGFRESTIFQTLFYVIYPLRVSFQGLIAAFLYSSPITQSILYITLSIAFIWYLLHADSLKKRVSQVQLALGELLVLAINICILILSVSDDQGYDNYHLRIFFGNLIILCNFGLNIIGVTFLAIKLLMGIFSAIKLKKKRNSQSAKAAWLQLIFLPFQQAAFGFEQVQITAFIHEYSKLKTEGKKSSKGKNLKDQVLKAELFSPLATMSEKLRLSNHTQYTISDTSTE